MLNCYSLATRLTRPFCGHNPARMGGIEETMNQPVYDTNFYRGEIERLTLTLTQPVNSTERTRLTNHLNAAKAHLAEVTTGKPLPLEQ